MREGRGGKYRGEAKGELLAQDVHELLIGPCVEIYLWLWCRGTFAGAKTICDFFSSPKIDWIGLARCSRIIKGFFLFKGNIV